MQCHDETTWYIIILKGILHKERATSTLRLKTVTANITPCSTKHTHILDKTNIKDMLSGLKTIKLLYI